MKICHKESSSGNSPDRSRAAGRNPVISPPASAAFCYRGDYISSHPAEPPSQRPSHRPHEPSLQPCPGVAGKNKDKYGKTLRHRQRTHGVETSKDPCACLCDADLGKSGLPSKSLCWFLPRFCHQEPVLAKIPYSSLFPPLPEEAGIHPQGSKRRAKTFNH